MKILVTGTAGFIGFHLTKKLLERGDIVIGADNINNYYETGLKYARLAETGIKSTNWSQEWYNKVQSKKYPNYSFVRMNLEDREQLNRLFEEEKFDMVCHLAAQAGVRYSLVNPQAYINSNITGFFNILEACRAFPVKHLVYASSSSVYGNSADMPLSVSQPTDNPVSLYAATKKSNELMAWTYSHLFGIPATGLRFFTVYGPWGRPDMAYFSFTKAILEGTPIKIFNNGDLYRDFTYVDDIVEGISRVIDHPPANATPPVRVYNIGNSDPVHLPCFIETLEQLIGGKARKEYVAMQPGDVYKTFADVSALQNDLGYQPSTSVETGLQKFWEWYRSFYQV